MRLLTIKMSGSLTFVPDHGALFFLLVCCIHLPYDIFALSYYILFYYVCYCLLEASCFLTIQKDSESRKEGRWKEPGRSREYYQAICMRKESMLNKRKR